MAQLTNTRIYGNLNVDAITTINGALNANGGINVTPLKNSTSTVDNSAKITLNSKIVDDKQDSANNEKKLSSIKLISENNSYGRVEHASMADYLVQSNSLFSYTTEIKNNAGKLLSLDLHRVNSEEHKTFDDSGSVTGLRSYDIDIDDTLYNISVSVSNFYKASDSEHEVIYDNVNSTYDTANTDPTGTFRGNTNTTKSTVNVQLTVPYEGGEIITDKTCDEKRIARPFDVRISNTEQLKKLLNYPKFRGYVAGDVINAGPGIILYAVVNYIATGTPSSYPVLFYVKSNEAYMACFSPSKGIFENKSSLDSGENLKVIVSTKELYDELTNIIA